MIRIKKPRRTPVTLNRGTALLTQYEDEIAKSPQTAGLPPETFRFSSAIYGCKAVKNALKKAQQSKCCYCEGEIGAHSPGDVEHFRPKAFSQQTSNGERFYPGYYWLAYAWTNLYLSCDICNRIGKRNLFPIGLGGIRARSPHDAVDRENGQLLDPGGPEDPRSHISFVGNVPKGNTDLGRCTVEVLGLDRIELNSRRLKHMKRIEALRNIVRAFDRPGVTPEQAKALADARTELEAAIQPSAEYSAMSQDLLAI